MQDRSTDVLKTEGHLMADDIEVFGLVVATRLIGLEKGALLQMTNEQGVQKTVTLTPAEMKDLLFQLTRQLNKSET